MRSKPVERWLLVAVMLVAFLIRCGVLWTYQDDLNDDRDAYLAIARQLWENGDFASGPGNLTAYRPPLYPLLLAPISGENQTFWRAAVHLSLSMGTLLLIWKVGRQLGLSLIPRLGAVTICALDPVLLRYLAFPMTETLSAFLSILLIALLTRDAETPSYTSASWIGVVFGLNVLCRPTFWAFGVAMAVWAGLVLMAKHPQASALLRNDVAIQRAVFRWYLILIGAGVTVFPWVARNTIVLGRPVIMTTHGGYTLLLGNNDAFYDEVVEQPWGTVWDGSRGPGQAAWLDDIFDELDAARITSEVKQDRWMSRRARETIRRRPVTFAKACLLRFLRFWSVIPGGEWSSSSPPLLRYGIATWYTALWIAFAVGLSRVVYQAATERIVMIRWVPLILMIASLVCVHFVYWSNARMRAPVMPEIALIAVVGLRRHFGESDA